MLDKFAISTDQVAMIIADAREDAIVGERERIIKLLENTIDHDWKGPEPCEACDQIDYLIALIKGENK